MLDIQFVSHMRQRRLSNKWVAGLFDADSSMQAVRFSSGLYPTIKFSQLDYGVVTAIHQRYGGIKSLSGARQLDTLTWNGSKVRHILEPIYPYLTVRQEIAAMLLEFQNYTVGRGNLLTPQKLRARESLYEKIRAYTGRASYEGVSMSRQWLSGFVGGDGSVTVQSRNPPSPVLSIAQKDIRVLEAIKKRYGGRLYAQNVSRLMWGGNEAGKILTKLLPHMMFKHKQAQLAITMCESIGAKGSKGLTDEQRDIRADLAEQIKELNHVNSRKNVSKRT